jgi:UPF0755 protein
MSNQKRSKRFGNIVIFIFFLLLVVLGCLVIWLSSQLPQYVSEKFGPPADSLSYKDQLFISLQLLLNESALETPLVDLQAPQSFTVHLGESVQEIAYRLQAEGFIQNIDAFSHYLMYSGLDTSIQAGDFVIENGMTAVDIARQFQDATPREASLIILPGWRMEEIAGSLPSTGLGISSEAFIAFGKNPAAEMLPGKWQEVENLEGYLFPGTYRVSREISIQELIWQILNDFDAQVSQKLEGVFLSSGISLEDAIIIASIVEREAVLDEEKPIIASVFLNRIRMGMRLESDPTIQYALGFQPDQATWWKNPLSSSDLTFDSPYNTYLVNGLPPTPICNPGLVSINAVAYPAQTDYYYFRAACDGSGRHNFAKTYEEHVANGCTE